MEGDNGLNTVEGTLQGFERNLAEDGKSQKTIESYVGDVAGFLAYLGRMGAEFGGESRRFHVTCYRDPLFESGYEASTVNKKINSLQPLPRGPIPNTRKGGGPE